LAKFLAITTENKKNSLEKPFLTTREAPAWLRSTKNTLAKCVSMQTDRSNRKHGRHVRYHLDHFLAWSEVGKRKSTSDVP
jgi:hypothetical protein